MKRNILAALLFLALAAVWFAAPAAAFNPNTRLSILKDAIQFSPANLQKYLKAREDVVTGGMIYDQRGIGFISPFAAGDVYGALVARLKSGETKGYGSYRSFGVLAALAAESVFPGTSFTAMDVKADRVLFDGAEEVKDAQLKVEAMISTYSPYWKDTRREVTAVMYDRAVNAVVDLWASAWKAGGQDPGAFPEVGAEITHVNQVLVDEQKRKAAAAAAASEPAEAPASTTPVAAALKDAKAIQQQLSRALPTFMPSDQPGFH